ncbi:MAG: hypothetical protein ACREF8_05975 [Chthoniobacterales bacterium]
MKLRDRLGNTLSEGNLVDVRLGGVNFTGHIIRLDEGGITKSRSGEVTKALIVVGFEMMIDPRAAKGDSINVGEITRVVDPASESLIDKIN